MTNTELNVKAAELVMGWVYYKRCSCHWLDSHNKRMAVRGVWSPSTDIVAAKELQAKMLADRWAVRIEGSKKGAVTITYKVTFFRFRVARQIFGKTIAETEELAITKAALAAVEARTESGE